MTALEVFKFLKGWLEGGGNPYNVSISTRKRMAQFVEDEIKRREKLKLNPGRPRVKGDRRAEQNRQAQARYRQKKRSELAESSELQ
jgi:hypothetical protein